MNALLAALLLQAAPMQTEAEKFEAAIKKMTDREYRMLVSGKELGSLTLKNRVETEGGRKIAVFESVIKMTHDGKTEEGSMTEKAELEGLRFLSRKLVGPKGEGEKLIEVKNGKVPLKKIDGGETTVELTKATVSEGVLHRLVCVQEQKVGAKLAIDVFDYDLHKGWDLQCLERKTVELGGEKHDAFIWRLSGENRMELKGGPITLKFEYTYWVSPEGTLLRYSMSSGDNKDENVLELKK